MTLRLDEADVLPFDYPAYAWEISRAANAMSSRAQEAGVAGEKLKAVIEASSQLTNGGDARFGGVAESARIDRSGGAGLESTANWWRRSRVCWIRRD